MRLNSQTAPMRGMRDHDAAVVVERDTVGTGGEQLREQAGAARGIVEFDAPDRVGARDRDVQCGLALVQHKAVRARRVGDDAVQAAGGGEAIDVAGRVLQTGAALVGEIQIAVGGEMQVVQAFEALARGGPESRVSIFPVAGSSTISPFLRSAMKARPSRCSFRPLGMPSYSIDDVPGALRRDAVDPAGLDIDA